MSMTRDASLRSSASITRLYYTEEFERHVVTPFIEGHLRPLTQSCIE